MALAEYDVESRTGTHAETEQMIARAEQLQNEGKHKQTIPILEKALETLPKHAQAAFLLGIAHATLASAGESTNALAEQWYSKAIELGRNSPRFANFATVGMSNLGNLLQNRGDLHGAIRLFQESIRRNMPNLPDPYTSLGMCYEKIGRIALAKKAFAKSLKIARNDALRLHMHDILPFVYASQAEMDEASRTYVDGFASLARETREGGKAALRIDNPLKELFTVPHYYLAYHGINYVATIADVAAVVKGTNAGLTYTAPWVAELKRKAAKRGNSVARQGTGAKGRIKVGFSSMFFKNHSVGKFIQGTIAHLDPERFEVVIFALRETWTPAHAPGDEIEQRLRKAAARWHDMPKVTLQGLRDVIEGERLDVLVYAEIGMDPGNYLLAMSRLAPVQIATHGHASTSGIGEIDYFVSYRAFETADAQTTYTERLVTLDDFLYYYPPVVPAVPSAAELWANLGVPVRPGVTRVYTCPQTLFKLTPDFDDVFKDVLLADPDAVLLLKTYASEYLDTILNTRLDAVFADKPEARKRVFVTRGLSNAEWFALLSHADVILDSYPFGGYTTSLEALYLGTPVVTLPHPLLMSGRCTAGFLRLLGLDELIASDRPGYVALAVRVARDPEFRQSVRSHIQRVKSRIYKRMGSVREWETLLEEVVAGKVPTMLHDPARAAAIAVGPYSFAAPLGAADPLASPPQPSPSPPVAHDQASPHGAPTPAPPRRRRRRHDDDDDL